MPGPEPLQHAGSTKMLFGDLAPSDVSESRLLPAAGRAVAAATLESLLVCLKVRLPVLDPGPPVPAVSRDVGGGGSRPMALPPSVPTPTTIVWLAQKARHTFPHCHAPTSYAIQMSAGATGFGTVFQGRFFALPCVSPVLWATNLRCQNTSAVQGFFSRGPLGGGRVGGVGAEGAEISEKVLF